MHYQYKEQKTGGNLELWAGDAGLKRVPFGKDTHYQLTIAWNRGPAQRIYVDDIGYELPEDGLALLVVAHTFYFDRPEDIVAWGFNRDFYCVIDHDQEVSCAGFIFYGFPNPMILAPDENTVRKISLLLPVFTDEFKDNDNLQGEMLRMLLKRLIVIITRTAKKQLLPEDTLAPEYDLSRQFSLLVEQNFREKHQVADYATLLFKSPKTLSNVFHKLGGNSPLQCWKGVGCCFIQINPWQRSPMSLAFWRAGTLAGCLSGSLEIRLLLYGLELKRTRRAFFLVRRDRVPLSISHRLYYRRSHEVALCARSKRGSPQARPVGAILYGRPYWATFAITFSSHVPDSSIARTKERQFNKPCCLTALLNWRSLSR
jgi:AraC family transcriptional activator of pobA